MAITKWNPWNEMEDLMQSVNRLWGRRPAGGAHEAMTAVDWAPAVDVAETDKEYVLKVEVPEVKKEDIKVALQEGILTVEGERKTEKDEKDKKFHRIERLYGKFSRSFRVPEDADEANVKAEFKDGMLYLRLTKTEKPEPKSVQIPVK